MKLRRLKARNIVMNLKKMDIEFPDLGLLLLTGKNGTGKSTCVEVASQVIFNKKLVAVPIWRVGVNGSASAELANGMIAEAKSNKQGKLSSFTLKGKGVDVAGTGTKAREHLAKFTTTHELWKNSHFIRSGGKDTFSRSADKNRKAIVEELLGMGWLVTAEKQGKKEYEAAKEIEMRAQVKHAQSVGRLAAAKAAYETAQESVEPVPPGELERKREKYLALHAEKANLTTAYTDAQKVLAEKVKAVSDVDTSLRAYETRLAQFRTQRAQMEGGVCPTCQQTVAGADTGPIDLQISTEVGKRDIEAAKVTPEQRLEIQTCSHNLQATFTQIGEKDSEARVVEAEGLALKARVELGATRDARVQQYKAAYDLESTKHLVEDEDYKLKLLNRTVADLSREGLGVKGLRANLLSDALMAVTMTTNRWLAEIVGPHMFVSIREEGSKIKFEIFGHGDGTFDGLNTGHQMRMDLALMLAFMEVSLEATGEGSSTLFFDEPFLGFDEEGIEIVGRILKQLSEVHCVVVITNNDAVVKSLLPDVRYVIKDGEYRRAA